MKSPLAEESTSAHIRKKARIGSRLLNRGLPRRSNTKAETQSRGACGCTGRAALLRRLGGALHMEIDPRFTPHSRMTRYTTVGLLYAMNRVRIETAPFTFTSIDEINRSARLID